MKFSTVLVFTVAVVAISFTGCDLDGSNTSSDGELGSSPTSSAFSVDVTGAKALALGGSPGISENTIGARSIDASSVTNDTLLRVMVDGSTEEAITIEGNQDTPPIQFIAIDPNGDIYVSFEYSFSDSAIGLFHLDVESNVLTAVNAEGFQMDEYGYGGDGVKNWYWDSGLSRTKPIVFGSDGSAFFVLRSYDNSGWGTDRVYKWIPGSGAVAQPQTPDVSGMNIERFQVDDAGRMYAYGRLEGLRSAQFLQVFDPRAMRGTYAFYSEGGSGYVRGYTVFGDRVYINGWGLYGGINGIAEAATSVVDDAVEITPRTLYDSDSNDWFSPEYSTHLQGGQEVHEGLFRYDSGTYVWADHWKTDSGALDGERIRVAQFQQYHGYARN